MTLEEILQKLDRTEGAVARNVLRGIILTIQEGRELEMTSSEILDAVCDELRKRGLDN